MRFFCLAVFALYLSACATTPIPQDTTTNPDPVSETQGTDQPTQPSPSEPDLVSPPVPVDPNVSADEPKDENVTDNDIIVSNDAFRGLSFWGSADVRPAFSAFKRSCDVIEAKDLNSELLEGSSQFGKTIDWSNVCQRADQVLMDQASVKAFFENEFLPVYFNGKQTGLLTAYYQPEILVSKTPTDTYREPILAVPSTLELKNQPRSKISAATSRVIAFGKPIDVFFMQIQGSGVLAFPDGSRLRASYADNNGYKYKSIGSVLIARGELEKDKASKQAIENWMEEEGPLKARELMNQNPRYIYFKDEPIVAGEGPKGAQRVPLTAMGSLAIDPKHYPYGVPIWIETKLPQKGGDYIGADTGLLLITQDTGNAIRGLNRGDIYFGSGPVAGNKAGVMKHPGQWIILLPTPLALLFANVS